MKGTSMTGLDKRYRALKRCHSALEIRSDFYLKILLLNLINLIW